MDDEKLAIILVWHLILGTLAHFRVIGVATIILRLPGNSSLKDKRKTVKSVVSRLRNSFNLAAQ